jgi:hypothetical protein
VSDQSSEDCLVDGDEGDDTRVIRLQSPDGNRVISLRFASPAIASNWFSEIHAVIDQLADSWKQQLADINIESLKGVQHLGWLEMRLVVEEDEEQQQSEPQTWKRVFAVLCQTV